MSSGFILYFYGVERERSYKNGLNQKIAAVGCVGAAVGISISSYKMFRKTFITYNENVTSIGFGPTNNGIGLVWSF